MTRWCGLRAVVLASAAAGLGACVSLEQPYVEKKSYVIEADVPAEQAEATSEHALRIRRFRVAKPYDEHSLTWREADGTITSDFYHVFAVPPGAMLANQARRYLRVAGPYAAVVDASSAASTPHVLEARITRLVGQRSASGQQHAVIEADFLLLDESGIDAVVLMLKTYTATVTLADGEPATLVHGLGEAWTQVLAQAATDLAAHTGS